MGYKEYFGSRIRNQNLNTKVIPSFIRVIVKIGTAFTIGKQSKTTQRMCIKEIEMVKEVNSLPV